MKNVFCNKLRLVPQSCQNQSRCHVLLPHLASLPISRVKMGVAIAVLWLGCPDKPFGRFLKIHMSTFTKGSSKPLLLRTLHVAKNQCVNLKFAKILHRRKNATFINSRLITKLTFDNLTCSDLAHTHRISFFHL